MTELQRILPIEFEAPKPINLTRVLNSQVDVLVACGVHKQIGMTSEAFCKEARELIVEFIYSETLAANGLDQVILVHYGVSDDYLAKVCGVETLFDLNKTTLYQDISLPPAFAVVQCNLGLKYKNRRIVDIRRDYKNEILSIVKEGLFAYLYWGNSILKKCFMDFPGSVSSDGHTPYLLLRGEKPYLVADEKDVLDPWGTPEKGETVAKPRAYPNFGSVTCVRWF